MEHDHNRAELERRWRARLESADNGLKAARKHLKSIEEARAAVEFPAPDGDYAYRQALHSETQALINFSRVLRAATDLFAHGIIPDEPE